MAWVKAKCIKHFLPLALLTAITLALVWPDPGTEIGSWKVGSFKVVQTFNVCTIFFVSGMSLKTQEIKEALRAYPAMIYGFVAILGLTPLVGFLPLEIPFQPKEFRVGLAIFCCVPTTLTSGVTLATQAKANTVLALMLTVGTNLLGIVTVPFMMGLVLNGADVSLDALDLLFKLGLTIFLPLAVGKVFRDSVAAVPPFMMANKVLMGFVNNGSLAFVVFQVASRSADSITSVPADRIFPVIAAGVCLHGIYFAFNGVVTEGLQRAGLISWKERKAVWLLTSQKTLPVSMTILTYLSEEDVGNHGLIAVPMIVGHLSQLFIDAYIAGKWAEMDEKANKSASQSAPKPVDDVQMKKSELFDNPNFDTDTLNGDDADFDANAAKFDTNAAAISAAFNTNAAKYEANPVPASNAEVV
eukprot:CAMPEP_0198228728 /NCGR_PEP_ID=MMETSP1445-20131203/113750_1 /TAXON_ID=36898 /ORGANISM="Pyramimonas sp., Strain CCMP2087" /LENGTH=413 /DNA_ID=CAMNT_0043909147 /DNA_START=295 /DNA_END=1536 /DNA_ORIENTATION=-